jgi:hypothetical protein
VTPAEFPVYHRCPPDGGGCRDQVDVSTLPDPPGSQFIPGGCRHTRTVPVTSVTGEALASLCLCCDRQLPARP